MSEQPTKQLDKDKIPTTQSSRRKISLKQHKFVEAYIATNGNATQAVIDAGYKCKNRAVANAIGVENLLKPAIAGALAIRKTEISKKTEITIEMLQSNLLGVAQKAYEEGKYSAAAQAYCGLLKSIGGMTGDRPHPDALKSKTIDAKRVEDMRAIADKYYAERYLATHRPMSAQNEGVKHIENICKDSIEDVTVLDLRPLAGPTEGDNSQADHPITPRPAGLDERTPPVSNATSLQNGPNGEVEDEGLVGSHVVRPHSPKLPQDSVGSS